MSAHGTTVSIKAKSAARFPFWVALLALFFQAVIPSGYMLNSARDGGSLITLCTSDGDLTAWMDKDGQVFETAPSDDGSNKNSDRHPEKCLSAGQSAALFAPFQELQTAPQIGLQNSGDPNRKYGLVVGHGLAAPPPPKTGPPVQA
jgi:hypothetical protein